ncbi:hypothetical protein QYF36_012461 [Acer negundo]|nr:hypothetical protein QYF36_012461 [Acer negundo]
MSKSINVYFDCEVPIAEMVTKASHGGNCQVDPTSSVGGHGTSSVMGLEDGKVHGTVKEKVHLFDEEDKEHGNVKKSVHLFREEDKEHSSVQKNIHLFDEEDKEHGMFHVMNPNQEGTFDTSVDHFHRIPNSPAYCNDNNFKPSPPSFSALPRPI